MLLIVHIYIRYPHTNPLYTPRWREAINIAKCVTVCVTTKIRTHYNWPVEVRWTLRVMVWIWVYEDKFTQTNYAAVIWPLYLKMAYETKP